MSEPTSVEVLREWLFAPTVGRLAVQEAVSVFPLRTAVVRGAEYLRLDQAGGRVGLVCGAGTARSGVEVVNACDARVLIVAGEPLSGGAHGLALTRSVLVPSGRVTSIPSRCVERVDRDVPGEPAPEGQSDLAGFVAAADDLGIEPGQNGAIVVVGGDIVAFEGFDAPETFAAVFPRRLRRYVALARERTGVPALWSPPAQHEAEAFVARVAALPLEVDPAVGEGVALRSLDGEISASALTSGDRAIHAKFVAGRNCLKRSTIF
jgi:hypothetical protein